MCIPKSEGGLDIRRLTDSSKRTSLSLIWCLLTNSGSLWVAWTRVYLLKSHSFWDVNEKYAGSWIWHKLIKLRDKAVVFLRAQIGKGKSKLFWFDNWLSMIKIDGYYRRLRHSISWD